MHRQVIAEQLEAALRRSFCAPHLQLLALDGVRPAESELREPWIPVKYGVSGVDEWIGVVPATVRFSTSSGAAQQTLRMAIKVNPPHGIARTLIPWVIRQNGINLDRPYWEYATAAESERTNQREQHVYTLAKHTSALQAVLPSYYGIGADPDTGEQLLFLEFIPDITRLDGAGVTGDWPADTIDAAIRAAAGWHAAFWNATETSLAWAGPKPTTAAMTADEPLWRALLDDARVRCPEIVCATSWRHRHQLIDTLPDWHRIKDQLPSTLVHNDFNQRNIGFRPAPLVLDWEFAQRNLAQRDLVELLTFVLPASADRSQIDAHLESHRSALLAAGVAEGVDRDSWMAGFQCELKVQALNRLAHQLMFGSRFPITYLKRINATVERLLDLYT